ncbi:MULTISPECIES: galactosyltransferase-related protein [Dickeya]|uniref:dTDP-Rha:A-D-GlcNAc-diphosphoryl polyprenol, A-3-L-rhamnosyl transferase WbbL n=1 Tax=Dickeya aquatica TaxID=1401087 RepID=A0A375A729_9GAMM|nr:MULTISPECIES: glycosyltransferase family 2 protein [Dickeya]SLM61835.1 dTDP-Rha:A-D-GlcNAc-diphosphoryl polyprenol, A-3-L-rhamnosyl transferase WbbL [Dickeya aquatica]
MNKIFISVVNHNSDELIIKSNVLSKLSEDFSVILKCNTPATPELIEHAKKSAIILLNESYGLGFAQNNNFVYNHCYHQLKISDSDFFLVLNPDVIIEKNDLESLYEIVKKEKPAICTINLFKDSEKTQLEYSIKKFPSLLTPWIALFKSTRPDIYDKASIEKPIPIDWAAGSFLLFRSEIYRKLNGFNEKFFMYFEDVDICRRAHKENISITYYPNIKATHLGAYNNRKILSRHFCWYLRSYLRYHFNF